MVGDPSTGFLVGQSQIFPDGSVKYSEYGNGGTSLSSPLFAGATAIADQVGGGSLGFLNPKLYKLSGGSAFPDIDHSRQVTNGVVRVDYVTARTAVTACGPPAHAGPDREFRPARAATTSPASASPPACRP